MPISSVYAISPVYDVTSSDPSVAGAGATAEVIAAAAGGAGGPTDVLVFSRAVFVAGVATYPVSVTLIGSVERKGAPAWRSSEGEKAELRPLTDTTFEITTDADPAAALGAPAGTSMTNWLVEWAGFRLLVVGAAIPQGAGWLTKAVLTL
jgi:hypothetical protein